MGFLIFLHVLVCLLLILVILLQSSRGGGLAGVFGGSDWGGVFGGRGPATLLSKATIWLGIFFALTSISIALISVKSPVRAKSYLQQVVEKEKKTSPANILPAIPGVPETPKEGQK